MCDICKTKAGHNYQIPKKVLKNLNTGHVFMNFGAKVGNFQQVGHFLSNITHFCQKLPKT